MSKIVSVLVPSSFSVQNKIMTVFQLGHEFGEYRGLAGSGLRVIVIPKGANAGKDIYDRVPHTNRGYYCFYDLSPCHCCLLLVPFVSQPRRVCYIPDLCVP